MSCVTSGSVSCSATVAKVGARDGVGRADDILCAEVDEDDIEPTTGHIAGRRLRVGIRSTSSKVLNSHKARDAHQGTKLEANATLLEMEINQIRRE